MPEKSITPLNRIITAVVSFILIAMVMSVLWHLFVQEVLMKSPSIPLRVRLGYDNPFLSLLALTAGFLLVACILYGIIINLFSKSNVSILTRMFIGILTGLLPVVILQLSTVGLPLSDPAMLSELFVMALGGGLFPVTQHAIGGYYLMQNGEWQYSSSKRILFFYE